MRKQKWLKCGDANTPVTRCSPGHSMMTTRWNGKMSARSWSVVNLGSNQGQRPLYIPRDAATVASHSHFANRKVDVNNKHKRNEFQVVEKLRVVHLKHKLNLASLLVVIARVQWKTTVESCLKVIDDVRLPVETWAPQSLRMWELANVSWLRNAWDPRLIADAKEEVWHAAVVKIRSCKWRWDHLERPTRPVVIGCLDRWPDPKLE